MIWEYPLIFGNTHIGVVNQVVQLLGSWFLGSDFLLNPFSKPSNADSISPPSLEENQYIFPIHNQSQIKILFIINWKTLFTTVWLFGRTRGLLITTPPYPFYISYVKSKGRWLEAYHFRGDQLPIASYEHLPFRQKKIMLKSDIGVESR